MWPDGDEHQTWLGLRRLSPSHPRALRCKLLAVLRQANDAGRLPWTGGLSHFGEPGGLANFLNPLYERQWNVSAKPPAGSPEQVLTLSADEFQRRLLRHVLPRGFVRLRGFGLLANCIRTRNLARCRELQGDVDCTTAPNELARGEPSGDSDSACPDAESLPCCVHCRQPALRPTAVLPRPTVVELVARTYPRPLLDSS